MQSTAFLDLLDFFCVLLSLKEAAQSNEPHCLSFHHKLAIGGGQASFKVVKQQQSWFQSCSRKHYKVLP